MKITEAQKRNELRIELQNALNDVEADIVWILQHELSDASATDRLEVLNKERQNHMAKLDAACDRSPNSDVVQAFPKGRW